MACGQYMNPGGTQHPVHDTWSQKCYQSSSLNAKGGGLEETLRIFQIQPREESPCHSAVGPWTYQADSDQGRELSWVVFSGHQRS